LGGQIIEFMYNKGNVTTITSISYTIDDPLTMTWTCSNFTLLPSTVPHLGWLRCIIAAGYGRAYSFTIHYCGGASGGTSNSNSDCGESRRVRPYDVFSYPPPTFLPGTLRLTSVLTGSTTLSMDSSNTASISFGVRYLQSSVGSGSLLKVTFGPSAATTRYSCFVNTAESTMTLLTCFTESDASGTINHFQISQCGWTSIGTDTLSYPIATPPVITGVKGCIDNNDNTTRQCPTSGGVTMRITGQYLTGSLRILVNGAECHITSLSSQGDRVDCQLPRGAGALQPVVAVANNLFGESARLINYAPPSITRLIGCSNVNDTSSSLNVVKCLREGGTILTLFGNNFGGEGASVLIGTSQCTSVQHNASNPDQLLTCILPAGTRTAQSVLVLQQNGDLSTSSSTISFTQCHPGSYDNGTIDCILCSPGSYTMVESQSKCDLCSAGFYANSTGSSECIRCPVGTFSKGENHTILPSTPFIAMFILHSHATFVVHRTWCN
jgi:hypothetical protein